MYYPKYICQNCGQDQVVQLVQDRDVMNLIVLKYSVLIGALLTTVAFVSLNQNVIPMQSENEDGIGIDAQSIFAFGSQVFYREVSKPGNEYLQSSVEGYSQNLVPTDAEDRAYVTAWQAGVAKFKSGYDRCSMALLRLATVPQMETSQEKASVCSDFLEGENEMLQFKDTFTVAKSSTSPATPSGYTIAMVLERVDTISGYADDADQACMKAVLADHAHRPEEFTRNLADARSAIQEMKRIYPELEVLSSDFS